MKCARSFKTVISRDSKWKAFCIGSTYRSLVWTLVAIGILFLVASFKQAASDCPSSIAWVAPCVEFGMKACAASPIFTMRPPFEVQWGSGSRKEILKSMMAPGGVCSMTEMQRLSHFRPDSSTVFNTSAASSLDDQVSSAAPLSCNFRSISCL